jgi:hypothetical protein
MEIKSKSKEEVENIAFRAMRNTTMLSNRNVDCFVAGWQAADRDFWQQLNSQKAQEFKDYLQQMITECEEKHKKLEEDLGYSGYMYSIPDSADAMFKLFERMIDSCEFILSNLENVNLYHGDYYKKLKGGEE